MELGGKSPFVVFEDADRDRAMDAAVFMIFSNNGERCTAGSRILVQRSIYDRFAQEFALRASRLRVGDPLDEQTIVGPMISRDHLAKVRRYIEMGPAEGAQLLAGGLDAPELPPHLANGNFVLPTVFADVRNDMAIAQDEIFGPVACLIPFEDEGRGAHRERYALRLSSYVWTGDLGRAHRVAAPSGGHVLRQQPERHDLRPFSGTKASGTAARRLVSLTFPAENVCVSLTVAISRWGPNGRGKRHGSTRAAAKITRAIDVPFRAPGPHRAAGRSGVGHVEIGRRCRALGVDTIVVRRAGYERRLSHQLRAALQGSTRATGCRTSSTTCRRIRRQSSSDV
jgi:hypothetical protein